MIRRRAIDAGVYAPVSCHSFRATGITVYLENKGTLETAQKIAAHESPRTTKLYDRTDDQLTLDEIEKISVPGVNAVSVDNDPARSCLAENFPEAHSRHDLAANDVGQRKPFSTLT